MLRTVNGEELREIISMSKNDNRLEIPSSRIKRTKVERTQGTEKYKYKLF
jgi:hypothetical protein